jgi:hypothetical protein
MSPHSRLLDKSICPDCRALLDVSGTCTGCGLRLVGPLAVRLHDTLVVADGLIAALRTPVVEPARAPAPRAPRNRATVPVVLLGLGAVCLLVAAVVFVGVTWSALGLAGRSTVLAGATLLLGAGAAALTRRRLWLGAGAVWTVVHLVLAVDLLAARSAGLLGLDDVPWRHLVAVLGASWLGLALGVVRSSRALGRPPAPATVFAVAGSAVAVGAEAWTVEHHLPATVGAVGLLVLGSGATRRTFRGLALGLVGLAALSWLFVLADALARLTDTPDDAAWWQHATGWPLLALAGYAALATSLRLPHGVRTGAAFVALATTGVLVAGPSTSATSDRLTAVGLTLAAAALAAVGPLLWARPAAVLAATGTVALAVDLLARPWPALDALPAWGAHPLSLALPAGHPHPWTAAVTALALPAAALAVTRHLPDEVRDRVRSRVRASAPVLAAIGAATTALLAGPDLPTAAAAAAGATAVGVVTVYAVRRAPALAGAVLALTLWPVALLLRVSAPSHLLATVSGATLTALLAIGVARSRPQAGVGTPAAGPATVLAGYAAWRGTALAGGTPAAEALVLATVAVAAALGSGSVHRGPTTRLAVELGAVPVGVTAVGLAGTLSGRGDVVALVLTVLGSGACLVAALHADRAALSWLGAVLLGAATVVRVVDALPAPERWTLPAAAVLLAAGVRRLRADQDLSSARLLGSGLALAFVPSLVLALDEPVGVRGVLVAMAGLAALAVGVRRRWAAPFAAGAVVTGILAVRHLGPVAEALPRWISLGTVGLALLVAGVTWESRRRNLHAAGHYLGALR